MGAPTYFKNPLLKSGFQKNGSIGEVPGTEVTVTEINQLKGVTSNIQQQLDSIVNAQSWGDVAVKNFSEFLAAVELSKTQPVRLHLTEDITINQSIKTDLTNCIIDGQDFYGFRFTENAIWTITGGSAVFTRATFYASTYSYPVKVIGILGLQHIIFQRCGFWNFTLDLPAQRRRNKFLFVYYDSQQGEPQTEIVFDAPLFFNQYGYADYAAAALVVEHDSTAPVRNVAVIAYDNRGDGSSMRSNKIAFISAMQKDSIVLDSSFVYDENEAAKPAIFTQYGTIPADLNISTLTASGNVTIAGNLTVEGETTTVHAQQIQSENDFIELRKNNPLALAEGQKAGVKIDNYDGTGSAAHIATDNSGTLYCGDEGDEQPLLTRLPEAQMQANKFLVWDANNRCATTASKEIDMTYSAYQQLTPAQIDLEATYFLYEEAQLTIINYDGNNNTSVTTYSSGVNVTLPAAENDNYDFLGYYTDAEYQTQPITKIVMLDDATVYARWDSIKTYSVQIKSSVNGAVIVSTRIEKGTSYTLPTHTAIGNYVFDNYTSGGSTLAEGQAITITADIVIIANYTALQALDMGIQDSTKKYLFAPSVISAFLRWGEPEPVEDYSADGYNVTTYAEPADMPTGFETLNSYVAGLLIATKNDTSNYSWAVASGVLTITNKNNLNYLTIPLAGYKIGTDTAAAGSRACMNIKAATATFFNINSQLAAEVVTSEPAYYGRNVIAYKESAL